MGEAKLARDFAADTGGTFRFVPTVQGTMGGKVHRRGTGRRAGAGVACLEEEILSRLTATWQPGPLALDNVYDYYETKSQGAARLFHNNYLTVPDTTRTD